MDLPIASWNVRLMLDKENVARPERKSAIIASELGKYNIDIAALSEVRFSNAGSITEEVGYTIFWSGKPVGEVREQGVAIAMRNSLIPKLSEDPKPVNEKMITLWLPLTQNRYCIVISAYAPTMTNSEEKISQLYAQINEMLENISDYNQIILLGDFNARTGIDNNTWKNMIRNFGTGKCNSNSKLLLETCSEHQLVITNTCFKQKQRIVKGNLLAATALLRFAL